MATVNIVNATTVSPFTIAGDVTTSIAVVLDTAADYCSKVESMYFCNTSTTTSAKLTVKVSVNDGSNEYLLASDLIIPPQTTISLVDRPILLDETDYIAVGADTNGNIDYVISGTSITD